MMKSKNNDYNWKQSRCNIIWNDISETTYIKISKGNLENQRKRNLDHILVVNHTNNVIILIPVNVIIYLSNLN